MHSSNTQPSVGKEEAEEEKKMIEGMMVKNQLEELYMRAVSRSFKPPVMVQRSESHCRTGHRLGPQDLRL